jgi:uncharacterized protein (TIGR00251 family)
VKVSVAAPPAEGRANEALLRLLADRFGVARRDLALVSGPRSRNKIVHLLGDPAALADRVADALAASPER